MNNKFQFSGEGSNTLIKVLEIFNIPDATIHAEKQIENIGMKSILKLLSTLGPEDLAAMEKLIKIKDRNFILKCYDFFTEKQMQDTFMTEYKSFIENFLSESGGNFSDEQIEKAQFELDKFYASLK